MTDDDICGAPTADGSPCQHPAGENGFCWLEAHNPDGSGVKTGRESKLTKERQEGMAAMIEQGHSKAAASRAYSIHPDTFTNWYERGQEDPESIFGDFFRRIARAKSESETEYVNELRHVAGEIEDTDTLRWMLQQRFPESWGESDAMAGASDDQPIINLPESVTNKWQRNPNDQR